MSVAAVTKFRRPKAKAPKTTWREGALTIFVRDRHYHVRGTIRHAGLKKRVRESLEIPFSRENEDLEAAKAAARALAEKVRGELGGGVAPRSFAEVALGYLQRPRKKKKPLGATSVVVIRELTAHFGTRILRDIPSAEFVSFIDERNVGNTAETRERQLNVLVALLTVAIAAGQYPTMPDFVRNQEARNPSTRKTRPVERVGTNIVSAIFRCSHIANTFQYAIEEITGARVSSVLFGCSLGDLNLAPGKMILRFHDTKPGFDVPAALPEEMRALVDAFLAWRGEQVRAGHVGPGSDEPLILTPKGVPYVKNDSYTGTRNKTAWAGAKRRAKILIEQEYELAISACEAKGDRRTADELRRKKADDLAILKRLTQHWFRHLLATTLGRLDPKAAMQQGGWKDARSLAGYMMSDAEYQRELVEKRGMTDWRGSDWHESDTRGDE
jgi:hypothetical protein